MLGRRLTPVLPDLMLTEALETTGLHSIAGLTGARHAKNSITYSQVLLVPIPRRVFTWRIFATTGSALVRRVFEGA